jgi:MFS family permease
MDGRERALPATDPEVTPRPAPASDGVAAPRPILTRPVMLLLVTALGSLGSFYLLLPVVPLYAAGSGAGGAAAGLCTGAMMVSTVLLEPAVPFLLRRFGHRVVMAAGLVLLGAPAFALAASLWWPVRR